MKKENEKQEECCSCGQRFEQNIEQMVEEAKSPSIFEHERKREEVKAAFAEKKK